MGKKFGKTQRYKLRQNVVGGIKLLKMMVDPDNDYFGARVYSAKELRLMAGRDISSEVASLKRLALVYISDSLVSVTPKGRHLAAHGWVWDYRIAPLHPLTKWWIYQKAKWSNPDMGKPSPPDS